MLKANGRSCWAYIGIVVAVLKRETYLVRHRFREALTAETLRARTPGEYSVALRRRKIFIPDSLLSARKRPVAELE